MSNDDDDSKFQYGRWLASPPPGEEVVISGISGHFPECSNIHQFRDNLFSKKEMITADDRRWKVKHPEVPKRLGKIPNLDKYDAGFFGVHYRQADFMDPVMRTFMERAIEAVMDAGVNPVELEGSKTGVFVSASWSDVENVTLANVMEPHMFTLTGNFRSLISQRLSYFLKLKAPAFNIDSACSSSFNALDTAFRAIRSGQCDNALVGCSNLLMNPGSSLQFFRLGLISPEGTCKVFDQNADGYVRAETVACLFLQKAKNSRRIYAKIINCKGNSDGFKEQGITYPSTKSQNQLMTEIYAESGIDPNDLSYLEAHGTGTQVGDPQEVEAIDVALAKKRQKRLLVGSVKCSIGHTEPCSGICSVTKVIIAMETGFIAPNINLRQIKKGMEGIEQGRIKIVTELTELEGDQAIVGINNFGFGGNNVHTILQRFKKNKLNNGIPNDNLPRLVYASGRTKEAVLSLLNELNDKILDAEYIGLLHQLYKINLPNHSYRGFTVVSKNGPLTTSWKLFKNQQPLYVYFGNFENNYKVVASYLLNFSSFKNSIKRIDEILQHKNLETFETALKKQDQHILYAIFTQIGFVDILKLLEIEPLAVYGHCSGTLISSYYYGLITFEQAVSTAIETINSDFDSELISDKAPKISSFIKESLVLCEGLFSASKNTFILNISDSHLTDKDVFLAKGNILYFLDILGRLYECGHNPQIHKLYPEVEYPVSRSTPMISPLIQWNHAKNWYTYKFSEYVSLDAQQKEYTISYLDEDYKFIAGHMIDGRNLVPATEYLNLVWKTIAQSRHLLTRDLPIVFENCKFVRAVTMPKTGFIKLLVMIQRATGMFEVTENNALVVSGRIRHRVDMSQEQTYSAPSTFEETNPAQILEQDEIYRELYLRGYNYSGVFKGIQKCNVGARQGLIKWEENWCSFMDKMLQMMILHTDSRELYVPVGIKKLTIDPMKQLQTDEVLGGEDPVFPVSFNKDSGIIRSGGIEISGLNVRSISRKKPRLEPVLEKYEFVANYTSLQLLQSIRVNTQIILENSLEIHFKAVELVDDYTDSTSEFLLPLICKSLDDAPVVIPDLTISTKMAVEEMVGVKAEHFMLTSESNLLLMVATKFFQRSSFAKPIYDAVRPNGYILTREDVDYVPDNLENFEIVTEHVTPSEKLILLQKSQKIPNNKLIEISSYNFDWLTELQKSLRNNSKTVIYSELQEFEGVLGFVNCLRREPSSGNQVNCFLMMDNAPKFDCENSFYKNQIKKNLAINIYKDKKWGTYRHLPLDEPQLVDCEHCYANVMTRGDISSLRWIEGATNKDSTTGTEEIFVHTYYSAVNFRDIMIASGRISVDAFSTDRIEIDCPMGFEFSGKDLSGRRVAGMTTRAFSTNVMGDPNFLWDVPDAWTLEEGATIPVVYSTVVYALQMVDELKPGSSILIHSATGGIGFAALNLCLHYKFDIYVTVGTAEKREYLKKHYPQIPDSHVGNSRDTSFEQMIKIGTKGRGVDIVLNSLSEDKLKASVACLARGGRFMEIGKFDLANNSSLELLLMEKGISYHGVMLDQVVKGDPVLKRRLVKIVQDGIKAGFVKPLPRVVFEREEVEAAFRYMMTGNHIGKVLVKIRNEESTTGIVTSKILHKAVPRFNCDIQKSYVILGGLGGVGLELADWLMIRGAKKLVLVSRTGIQSGYQTQKLKILTSYGVEVKISVKDVTTLQGCTDLIKEANELGPIDGIFNLAVVLKDALFEDQTEENFAISLAPKAQATIFLDQITRTLCPDLRYFVIFSSVSCGRGNAGQTNYGMANSIMERLCEKRKREGLPATAIQWGAIGDVGLVAKMQKENKELVIGGTLQQKISSCLEVLDKFLKQDNPIVASMVVAEKRDRGTGVLSAVETVANVLGIKDLKTVSKHVTLAELGMDSMMGTEIVQLLEKDFEIYLTAKDIRSLTIAKLDEMEHEKKSNMEEINFTKSTDGANLLIQHIPDGKSCHLPILKLPSQVQDDEVAPTVFVLPGIDGVFKSLEPLTKCLKCHVIGAQYKFYDSEEAIDEMAINILSHIEKHIPKHKPFTIIGYSFGVAVGLELVRLLEGRGYYGKIIAIDGSPTYLHSCAKKFFPFETDAELQSNLFYKILTMLVAVDLLSSVKDKLMQCADMETRIDLALSLVPFEVKDKLEIQAAVALYKRLKAIINYRYSEEKIKSTVHLFKTKNPLADDDDNYQLAKLCEQEVDVTVVDGDHATMLNQIDLADGINKLITQ